MNIMKNQKKCQLDALFFVSLIQNVYCQIFLYELWYYLCKNSFTINYFQKEIATKYNQRLSKIPYLKSSEKYI